VGDAYIHTVLTFVTATDWRLAKRNLRIAAHSQRPDGLLAMAAAGDLSQAVVTIPDYSLHWIRALARYWQYSGDGETLLELAPTALQIAEAFEHWREEDGLLHGVPGWVFIDWAQTERAEVVGALNAFIQLHWPTSRTSSSRPALLRTGRGLCATGQTVPERVLSCSGTRFDACTSMPLTDQGPVAA